jgi:hypothetical protein
MVAAASGLPTMCVVFLFAHRFPLCYGRSRARALARSRPGCGCVYRHTSPYLAGAFAVVVLPPSCYEAASQVLTTPVLVCLGACVLPCQVFLDRVYFVEAFENSVQSVVVELLDDCYGSDAVQREDRVYHLHHLVIRDVLVTAPPAQ